MQLKILVISDYRTTHTVRPEAEAFIGLAERGHEVHIMTFPEAAYVARFKEKGIQVIPFHPIKKSDPAEIKKIRDEVRDRGIQILHAFNSPSSVSAVKAAKKLDVKLCLYRGYLGNISRWDPFAYRKYLHPRVDMIMCNSQGVTDYLRSRLWTRKKRAQTISKGHRMEWYADIQAHDIRRELGLAKDRFLYVSVANNRSMKGIPYLLEAVKRSRTDFTLLLIGRDMDTARNIRYVKREGIQDKVLFLGYRKDVLSIVKDCDAFVSSSIKGESITKAIIEGLSLGLPAIITDIAGNVELVKPGYNGLVVPKKNAQALAGAMDTLCADRQKAKEYGKQAPIWLTDTLHASTTIDTLESAYLALMNQA